MTAFVPTPSKPLHLICRYASAEQKCGRPLARSRTACTTPLLHQCSQLPGTSLSPRPRVGPAAGPNAERYGARAAHWDERVRVDAAPELPAMPVRAEVWTVAPAV